MKSQGIPYSPNNEPTISGAAGSVKQKTNKITARSELETKLIHFIHC